MSACHLGTLAERTGQKLNIEMEVEVDQGSALGQKTWVCLVLFLPINKVET